MSDLSTRFASLNDVPAKLDWADVERRVAQAAGASARRVSGPVVRPPLPGRTGQARNASRRWSVPLRATAGLVLAAILIALVGLAIVGGRPFDTHVILPAVTAAPSTVVVPTATATAAAGACPSGHSASGVRTFDLGNNKRIANDVTSAPMVLSCDLYVTYVTRGTNRGGIDRVDGVSGAVSSFVPAGIVVDIDTTGTDLWAFDASVGDNTPSNIDQLDPLTGAVLRRIPFNQNVLTLTVIDGRAWLTGYRAPTIRVVDLASGKLAPSIPVPAGELYVGDEAVWATTKGPPSSLARIDRHTLAVSTVPLPPLVAGLGVAGDRIFVATADGRVLGLDGSTGRVFSSVQLEADHSYGVNLVAAGSHVWAQPIAIVPRGSGRGTLSSEIDEIDAATGQIVRRIDYASSQPFYLWADATHLWAADADHPLVQVVGPAG